MLARAGHPVSCASNRWTSPGSVWTSHTPHLRKSATARTGNASIVFNVTLSASSGGMITVDFATADGTALASQNYIAAAGTLTFTPGTLTQSITVAVIGDSGGNLVQTGEGADIVVMGTDTIDESFEFTQAMLDNLDGV